jgi:hypothetical protein
LILFASSVAMKQKIFSCRVKAVPSRYSTTSAEGFPPVSGTARTATTSVLWMPDIASVRSGRRRLPSVGVATPLPPPSCCSTCKPTVPTCSTTLTEPWPVAAEAYTHSADGALALRSRQWASAAAAAALAVSMTPTRRRVIGDMMATIFFYTVVASLCRLPAAAGRCGAQGCRRVELATCSGLPTTASTSTHVACAPCTSRSLAAGQFTRIGIRLDFEDSCTVQGFTVIRTTFSVKH